MNLNTPITEIVQENTPATEEDALIIMNNLVGAIKSHPGFSQLRMNEAHNFNEVSDNSFRIAPGEFYIPISNEYIVEIKAIFSSEGHFTIIVDGYDPSRDNEYIYRDELSGDNYNTLGDILNASVESVKNQWCHQLEMAGASTEIVRDIVSETYPMEYPEPTEDISMSLE